MADLEQREGLNIPDTTLMEFLDAIEGKLTLLTGMIDYTEFSLTLEDIRKPMLAIGKPGIGKTCGIISIIKKLNKELPKDKKLGFKKILLGQTVVGSLSGIPVSRPDGTVVRVQMPDLPNEKRDGEYGVLFLDEITTADEMQVQPALGLADDSRSLGEYTLPEHWVIIGAGNGPDCSNFVRLDDMTISRFQCFNLKYEYKKDFRPYALGKGLSEDIIAFLNFDESLCVRVESTEMDSAGKLFPCPRSWERLSVELRMRDAMRKPVGYDEISTFAGCIIGARAGLEFYSFMQFKKDLHYNPDDIIDGKAADPQPGMAPQEFHILLQQLVKRVRKELSDTRDENGDHPLLTYQHTSNMVSWLLRVDELDYKLNALAMFLQDIPEFKEIMFDRDFEEMCPELVDFFEEHSDLIINNADDIRGDIG